MAVQTESRTALRELIDLLSEVDQRWAERLGVAFYPLHSGFRSEDFWHHQGLPSWPDLASALTCAVAR